MLKTITIIPNENKLAVPLYHKESIEKNHYELAAEFCFLVGIDYDNTYKNLLMRDCIVIITLDKDTIITWLPNEISEKQYQKLLELKPYFAKFSYQEFKAWFKDDFYIHSSKEIPENKVLEEFYQQLFIYYNQERIRKRKKEE